MAILSPLLGPATTIWNSVSCQAWDSLVAMCRDGTLSQLQSIQIGKLAVYEISVGKGSTLFGTEREGHPVAVLNVHDDKFWVRLALFADMVCLFTSSTITSGATLALFAPKLIDSKGLFRELYVGRNHVARSDSIFRSKSCFFSSISSSNQSHRSSSKIANTFPTAPISRLLFPPVLPVSSEEATTSKMRASTSLLITISQMRCLLHFCPQI